HRQGCARRCQLAGLAGALLQLAVDAVVTLMKEFDRRKLLRRVLGGLLLAALFSIAPPADAERIKDIAMVEGVRANQLVGYGLVVGLDGTGDQTSQTPFTVQSIRNMLQQFG